MKQVFYIVNPAGVIHECTEAHAANRLRQVGFRFPTADELKEYLARKEAGYTRRQGGGKPFVQDKSDPIARPWNPDPRKEMDRIQEELEKGRSIMPQQQFDATDSAIKVAEELGIDLAEVEGSGAEGRIIKSDVMAHFEALHDDGEPEAEE